MIVILLIHIALCFIFCRVVGNSWQGTILILIMKIIFTFTIAIYAEMKITYN